MSTFIGYIYAARFGVLITQCRKNDISFNKACLETEFSEKLDSATAQKKELLDTKHRLLKNKIHLKPWVEEFKSYQNIETLDRSVVVTLIESIIVYSKESVTVIFHHQDEIQEMMALAGVTAIDRKKAAL